MIDELTGLIQQTLAELDARRAGTRGLEERPPLADVAPANPSTGLHGPTALEFRAKARAYIWAARTLVGTGSYDVAADIVGYAAEFALKARYLTRQGWANWPGGPEEATRRGVPEQLMTHDLERLLKLSANTAIDQAGLHNIDWKRACEWRVEHRYRPLGAANADQVLRQIDDTEVLCRELALHTAASRLRDVETAVAEEHGPFNLFAVATPAPHQALWEIQCAAWWLLPDSGKDAVGQAIWDRCLDALDDDLQGLFSNFRAMHPLNPLVRGYGMLAFGFGAFEHSFVQLNRAIVAGLGPLPNAILITCVPRPQPDAAPSVPDRGDDVTDTNVVDAPGA